ncbi:MAG: calcium-binding protein [Methylacidiphilales bacterium]|nr:calcium-binding protein [Candidatus Methylacidiphilales bacterium]NJR19090.1 calcium-binding protein [Calothrix sp. CSU_2_0]
MAIFNGNDSDNNFTGTATADTMRGRNGNDILDGRGGNDTILGGKDDDQIFGGAGADRLSGDGKESLFDNPEMGSDILVGGRGTDILYAWGDDILVGGGSNQYDAQLITDLQNDPFATAIVPDGQADTFVAMNKNGAGYTLTIADFEVGIDKIDLRSFGVTDALGFTEIQDKGSYFEAKTAEFGGAELVLRINVDPNSLTYVA